VLFRPLPYKEAAQLVDVLSSKIGAERDSKLFDSYGDFLAWKNHSTSFDELAACPGRARREISPGKARPSGFSDSGERRLLLIARRARRSRPDIRTSGCGQRDMAVLSHHFWQSRLGGAADIVGASVTLDGRTCVITGVMPERLQLLSETG